MQEFDDSKYVEYLEKREQELHDDSIEDLIIPQYISDINAQALQKPDTIYISSDEELEDGEEDDEIVAGYVETLYSSESDSSYRTANTERDISRSYIGNSSGSVRPIEDITKNVIVIDSDTEDSIEIPPRKPRPAISSNKARIINKALRKKKRMLKKKLRIKKNGLIRQKKAKRELAKAAIKNFGVGIIKCHECNQVTTRNILDSLSNLSRVRGDSRPFCLGCARLHSFAVCEDELKDIIRWFVMGKLPSYDLPPKCSNIDVIRCLKNRRRYMEKRSMQSGADASELVTTGELYQICVESNFRCAVSGHALYFRSRNYNRTPYWSLSLDHIDALNYSKEIPISWSKHNIQPMSTVLNTIKGHVPNNELIRWYNELMRSKVIEL